MTTVHINGQIVKKEDLDKICITNKDVIKFLSSKLSARNEEKGGDG